MSNFFRRLRAAWSMLQTYPGRLALPDNYWTDADAKRGRIFLTSDTGAKLRHMRWNRVFLTASNAIADQQDATYQMRRGLWGACNGG